MKAFVIGMGKMGKAIAYALDKLGTEVLVDDVNQTTLSNSIIELERKGVKVQKNSRSLPKNLDVVICAAPYVAYPHIAFEALKRDIPWCDLGGNPEISKQLQELALNLKTYALTDLGLAPGLINILMEEKWHEGAESCHMMVGGLPRIKPNNDLGYHLVFNANGLWNEYIGNCELIKDGEIATHSARSLYQIINHCYNKLPLEAFLTKGALSHSLKLMKSRGVKDFCYKTIRYQGHLEKLDPLMELPQGEFVKYVENTCGWNDEDVVIMTVGVDNEEWFYIIEADENWTAMQKGTAFPAAAVAYLIGNRQIKMNTYVGTYADIPISEFKVLLNAIGIEL